MKTYRLNSLSLLLISVLLSSVSSGCVNLEKKFPNIKTYSLDVSSQQHSAASEKPVSIRVNGFSSAPAFADRYLTYRTGETAYEQDFYNQLISSPAGIIHDQAAAWLKGSPRISFIQPPVSEVETDLALDGKILELYGDYRNPDQPKAVLKIQLTLSGADTENTGIVFQKIYASEIPMKQPSPKELTEGWNLGLAKILADFEKEFKTAAE